MAQLRTVLAALLMAVLVVSAHAQQPLDDYPGYDNENDFDSTDDDYEELLQEEQRASGSGAVSASGSTAASAAGTATDTASGSTAGSADATSAAGSAAAAADGAASSAAADGAAGSAAADTAAGSAAADTAAGSAAAGASASAEASGSGAEASSDLPGEDAKKAKKHGKKPRKPPMMMNPMMVNPMMMNPMMMNPMMRMMMHNNQGSGSNFPPFMMQQFPAAMRDMMSSDIKHEDWSKLGGMGGLTGPHPMGSFGTGGMPNALALGGAISNPMIPMMGHSAAYGGLNSPLEGGMMNPGSVSAVYGPSMPQMNPSLLGGLPGQFGGIHAPQSFGNPMSLNPMMHAMSLASARAGAGAMANPMMGMGGMGGMMNPMMMGGMGGMMPGMGMMGGMHGMMNPMMGGMMNPMMGGMRGMMNPMMGGMGGMGGMMPGMGMMGGMHGMMNPMMGGMHGMMNPMMGGMHGMMNPMMGGMMNPMMMGSMHGMMNPMMRHGMMRGMGMMGMNPMMGGFHVAMDENNQDQSNSPQDSPLAPSLEESSPPQNLQQDDLDYAHRRETYSSSFDEQPHNWE